jgi:hypothetical protein
MFKLEITEEYRVFYGKNVFVARYPGGWNIGETRKEAVINAAIFCLGDEEEIRELIEAVYDAGAESVKGE